MEKSRNESAPSYGSVLRDVVESGAHLLHDEVALLKAELARSVASARDHLTQAALFGTLVALSVLPFMAFLVIGLGVLLDGRYWLSSLLVGLVFASVGGALAYRAWLKLKAEDFTLPRTRRSLGKDALAVQSKVEDVKDAATSGGKNELERYH